MNALPTDTGARLAALGGADEGVRPHIPHLNAVVATVHYCVAVPLQKETLVSAPHWGRVRNADAFAFPKVTVLWLSVAH